MDIDPDLIGTLVRTYRFISDVHKISWEDLPHPAFAIIPVVIIAFGLKIESTWKFTVIALSRLLFVVYLLILLKLAILALPAVGYGCIIYTLVMGAKLLVEQMLEIVDRNDPNNRSVVWLRVIADDIRRR
ncbi:hypothetical protein TWF970_005636 [Orbilia oligospora]|uniref:Uncharacterized protein n=1 Tax=Orbilia oligospora TaxID=2813651 RepID=A0A7C8RP60_ORBOL|nr:hypothetical protein TWF970_005636 [Orbilia oligospora]